MINGLIDDSFGSGKASLVPAAPGLQSCVKTVKKQQNTYIGYTETL